MKPPRQAAPKTPKEEVPYWLKSLFGVPLALLGGLVTFCFALFILFYVVSRIEGERPLPNLTGLLTIWLFLGAGPLGLAVLLLCSQRTSKRIWCRVLLGMLLLFLAVGADE